MSDAHGVLLGVDVGTTNVKAAAFALDGSCRVLAARRLPVQRPRPNWAEYDPAEVEAATFATLREVTSALASEGGGRVHGVAVSSMAETAVPLDGQGRALHAAIAWHDQRTDAQAAWWRDHVGSERVGSITGLPILPIFGIQKILWLREHQPQVYDAMVTWANMADFIAYRLSGALATDLSLASRMMTLDLNARTWSSELLQACDVDPGRFADLVPSGTAIGEVQSEAADATGLARGVPVVSGGHDHPCGAFALGALSEGDVLDSMGTSESLVSATSRPVTDPAVVAAGYQQGIHVVPDRTYCNGGLYASGAAVEWARTLLGDGDEGVESVVRLAKGGSDRGLLFLPHLSMANPPYVDERSRGAFVGLSLGTTKADLARALVRGLAFEAQASLKGMEGMLGVRARRLRLTGGGSRNALLVADKAALFEGTTEIAEVDEASALGAAMLAGLGAGVFADAREAVARMSPAGVPVERSSEVVAAAHAGFGVYRTLYERLAPLHHELHETSQDR